MDEPDETRDEDGDDGVEIPVEVDEDDGDDESTSSLGEASSSEVDGEETPEASDDVDAAADENLDDGNLDDEEGDDGELDDLYVDPDESDVEVVDEESMPPGDTVESEEPPESVLEAKAEQETDEPSESEGDREDEAAVADDEAAEPEAESDDEPAVDAPEHDGTGGEEAPEEEGPDPAVLEERIDELEAELDDVRSERDEFEERMKRAAADLDNFRKRAEREKKELEKYGAKDLVEDLLETIDNLERALEHSDSSDEANIIQGVEMVLRQIHTTLEKHGIQQFDAEGSQFDPERHEAIQQVETSEHESGEVVEEFQKGYKMHDRLLRPAMVSVAENVGGDEQGEEGSDETAAEEADDAADETAGAEAEGESSDADGSSEDGSEADDGTDPTSEAGE